MNKSGLQKISAVGHLILQNDPPCRITSATLYLLTFQVTKLFPDRHIFAVLRRTEVSEFAKNVFDHTDSTPTVISIAIQ